MLPNLFRRLFAEGAMTAAFLPVFSEYLSKGDEESTNAFLSTSGAERLPKPKSVRWTLTSDT